MPSLWFIFGGVLGFTLLSGLLGVYYYNVMSGLRNRMDESLRTIDILVDRRQGQLLLVADLLRKLELKGLDEAQMALESGRKVMDTHDVPGKSRGLADADKAIQALMIAAHEQRELRNNADFDPSQRAIEKTNIELDGARRYFNALVRDYNIKVERLPSAIYAMLLKMKKADYLDPGK
jgi:LemA protein